MPVPLSWAIHVSFSLAILLWFPLSLWYFQSNWYYFVYLSLSCFLHIYILWNIHFHSIIFRAPKSARHSKFTPDAVAPALSKNGRILAKPGKSELFNPMLSNFQTHDLNNAREFHKACMQRFVGVKRLLPLRWALQFSIIKPSLVNNKDSS